MKKAIIFYSDNETDEKIANKVIVNLFNIAQELNIPITTACLKKKLDFGDINLVFPWNRHPFSQFRQILSALLHTEADIIYFCEADILYHKSHFDFIPPTNDAYYYNTNFWRLWVGERIATRTDGDMLLSGFCGYRDLLLGHYQRRVVKILQNQIDTILKGDEVQNEGYSKHMGFEPGGHMKPRGVDEYPMKSWQSEYPNIDIRHDNNLTKGKRYKKDYHDPKWAQGWIESEFIPTWGNTKDLVSWLYE